MEQTIDSLPEGQAKERVKEPTLKERLEKDLESITKQLAQIRQQEQIVARQKIALETLEGYLKSRIPKE